MKHKKFDKEHEKYKQLIMRMQSRRRAEGANKMRLNYPNDQLYSQDGKTDTIQYGYQRYDEDIKARGLPQRSIPGRVMPNSTRHYRQNDQKNMIQQQYLKKSESQRNTNLYVNQQIVSQNQSKSPQQLYQRSERNQKYQRNQRNQKYQRNHTAPDQTNQDYERLHQKLDSIQNKISQMKNNLQKKRQEKRKAMENNKIIQQPSALKGFVTQVSEHTNIHNFQKNPYSPKHNIYYVSEIIRSYKEQQSIGRQHLHTSLQILRMLENAKIPSLKEVQLRKVTLPRRKGYQNKKTVVFDLDETLIHCNESLESPYDVKLPITFPTGEVIEAGINIRPYAFQILQQLSNNFEVIVFTASHSCYANVVLDHLDPHHLYIHHRLYRQHCYATPEGIYIKDLRVIDRELSSMMLVDNAAYSYAFQLDNGIPIIPYYHGEEDFELRVLQNYIQSTMLVKDIRDVNRKTFKLHEYSKYYHDPDGLVEQIYISEEKNH